MPKLQLFVSIHVATEAEHFESEVAVLTGIIVPRPSPHITVLEGIAEPDVITHMILPCRVKPVIADPAMQDVSATVLGNLQETGLRPALR